MHNDPRGHFGYCKSSKQLGRYAVTMTNTRTATTYQLIFQQCRGYM